ncbi:hypothetical protein FQN54_009542 [Arachnomyces sp. PD_36]|nr:hypothetical protein FQN54_009542 [Arachnomyces sp. PD_36]
MGYLRASLDDESGVPDSDQRSSKQFGSHPNPTDGAASYKRPQSRWSSLPWRLEILSWLGSLCFFIAIVIVLRVLDGRPLPDLRFGISPNAIIGLLATFAEFLLIVPVHSAIGQIKWLQALQTRPMDNFRTIDEASRGPWGSILLLARRNGGLTASFGAVVTIVALGISTFFQQALKYDTIYPHSDDALMPITQYMNGTGTAPIGGVGSASGVDIELLSAPYVALFSPPDTDFTATAHCGTGNCTWEPYQTLGICNTCEDLTAKLEITKERIVPHDNEGLAYNTNYYRLPNGFGLTGLTPGDMVNQVAFLTSNAMMNITTTVSGVEIAPVSPVWDSVAFANNGSKLFSVFAVGASPGTIPTQEDVNFTYDPMTGGVFAPPVAFECVLQACIRTMRAEFNGGKLTETELSTWVNQTQGQPSGGYNYPDIILQPPGSSAPFIASGRAMDGTSNWLSDLLVGNATSPGDDPWKLSTPAYSSALIQPLYMAMNDSLTGFPDLMDNLAKSLSRSLRDIPYQPSPVRGKAFTSTSHAVVTWEWLILPIFELIGSLVFLIAVIMETRKRGLVPWTNNVLAYFFHGLDEGPLGRNFRESQDVMEDEARETLMEFQPHKDGGRLVIAKP